LNKLKINIIISCFFIFSFLSCNQKKEKKIEAITIAQTEIKLDLLDLQKKNRLGKDTIVIIANDPVYHKLKKYNAVSASLLIKNEIDLTKIDPKNTKIVFECIDGYKPEMPLENRFISFILRFQKKILSINGLIIWLE
jgi:hypothetical protein